MMRILVLCSHFEPDLSAGSFRNTALVRELERRIDGDGRIDVVTSQPNRYQSYAVSAPEREERGKVRVVRIPLPSHRNGLLDQSRAFAAYARGVWRRVGRGRYDLVYASSAKLFTAFLGALVAKRLGVPLYLDIRDIFSEGVRDLLKRSPMRVAVPVFRLIERFTTRAADRVNLVSPGLRDHFERLAPAQSFSFHTNGIDAEFLGQDYQAKRDRAGVVEILYAGNIGAGQGLHRIVPEAARRLGPGYHLRVIGDGGMRPELERRVQAAKLDNVILEPPVPRAVLIERYREAAILFLHVNDFPTFRSALPSKIFEYAATGKPILAGVAGYPADFLREHVDNTAVFSPCDAAEMLRQLDTLRLELTPRTTFTRQFGRRRIMRRLAADVLEVAGDARQPAAAIARST